jgi:hypothetical protein
MAETNKKDKELTPGVTPTPPADETPAVKESLNADVINKLADAIIGKTKPAALGGTPFDPSTEEVKEKTPADLAAEYFDHLRKIEVLKAFPHKGIMVTSDLQIFHPTPHGENALANHISDNTINGVPRVTFEPFDKPTV